jgi:hypothetical protein
MTVRDKAMERDIQAPEREGAVCLTQGRGKRDNECSEDQVLAQSLEGDEIEGRRELRSVRVDAAGVKNFYFIFKER